MLRHALGNYSTFIFRIPKTKNREFAKLPVIRGTGAAYSAMHLLLDLDPYI